MAETEKHELKDVEVPRIVKPRSHKAKKPDYFTKDEMNQFMGRIESLLSKSGEDKQPSLDPPPQKSVKTEDGPPPVLLPSPVPHGIHNELGGVMRPQRKAVQQQGPLTGHALLDKLFFH
jgi:hypothetical protein